MKRIRSARTLAAVEAGPVANKTKQRPKQREIEMDMKRHNRKWRLLVMCPPT